MFYDYFILYVLKHAFLLIHSMVLELYFDTFQDRSEATLFFTINS